METETKTTNPEEKTMLNIGTMTIAELEQYASALTEKHKARIRTLRALVRAREAEA